MGMLKAQTLLTLLDRLDHSDPRAVQRFNSLAHARLTSYPVLMSGAGFVAVRLPWPGEDGYRTVTRFHRGAHYRRRLVVKALLERCSGE
jgi:hypothetical protein